MTRWKSSCDQHDTWVKNSYQSSADLTNATLTYLRTLGLSEGCAFELFPTAINALAEIGDTRAVQPLIETFKPKQSWTLWGGQTITIAAICALEKFGDTRAVGPLIKLVKDIEEDRMNLRGAGGFRYSWEDDIIKTSKTALKNLGHEEEVQ